MVNDTSPDSPRARRLDDGSVQLRTAVTGAPDRILTAGQDGPRLTGHEDPTTRQLLAALRYMRQASLPSLKPLLPLLLSLKGKPYRLERYFPFEPFFRTRVAKVTLFKTARQVSKSSSLSAQGLLQSNSIPHFSTLFVTPLFEMIRRFSQNYVRRFIEESPMKALFTGKSTVNSVLQRTFKNFSQMIFSFAYLDAERTRGISADKNCLASGTLVDMADGVRVPVEDVVVGSAVLSADKSGSITVDRVTDKIYQGVQRVYRVTFSDGRSLRCTADERFLRTDGRWVELSRLLVGPPPTLRGQAARLRPKVNAIRLFVGRRDHLQIQQDVVVADHVPARREAVAVLPPQGGQAGRVRADATPTGAERRLCLRPGVSMPGGPAGGAATGLPEQAVLQRTAANATGGERGACDAVALVSVTCDGEDRVWDLNTERHHAFFADGVLVHNCIDEVQDMNWDFLDIIHETMSGSEEWGLIQYAGTPKSLDNTIERLWRESSQAEWLMQCRRGGCNHWNIPSIEHDLVAMIGPAHDDVGPNCPGIVCGKCRKPIDPATGRWYHFNKELRWQQAGYHVPQIIMPMHYANKVKWRTLTDKLVTMPPNKFFNEVCGESYDSGSKLVTITELKAACCLPWANVPDEAKASLRPYKHRVIAVDWGGNGGMVRVGKQTVQRTSFTVVAALGITSAGKIDVLWGYRVIRSLDFDFEVNLIVSAVRTFKASHLVHDYGGAGAEREYLLVRAGFPHERIIPVRYHGAAAKHPMVYRAPTDEHPRHWYSLDKSWSLGLTCHAIRKGFVRFFKYDFKSEEQPGLVHDFLALQEENVERRGLTDVRYITRNPGMTDDFAQATNIGCAALWYMTDGWPDLAAPDRFQIDKTLLSKINPSKPDWLAV